MMNETEKLQNAIELIETMRGGDYAVKGGGIGTPFIYCTNEKLKLGLKMNLKPDFETERYKATFTAYLSETGSPMDANAVKELGDEVWRMRILLDALETSAFTPAQDEWNRFKDWLAVKEEQTQTAPTMSM